MKHITTILLILTSVVTNAQVSNTSYQTKSGEKVLRFSIVVPVDRNAAWELFTKDSQLVRWIAPVAHMDLRTGGTLTTNYDKAKPLSDSTSIKIGVINYIENELLTLKVNLNNNFAQTVQDEDANLQEILQFSDAGKGKTRIISSMVGWGQGADWDKTYGFFEKGNDWTFKELLKVFQNSASNRK
jgi:uncharacterized protein YndB with AHSA1/START domain